MHRHTDLQMSTERERERDDDAHRYTNKLQVIRYIYGVVHMLSQ